MKKKSKKGKSIKIDDKTILRKNPDLATRAIDQEVILLPIYKTSDEINCIYTLNKSGSQVWDLINGKRKLGEIKKIILDKFDATPKQVDKELKNLLADLHQIQAISYA